MKRTPLRRKTPLKADPEKTAEWKRKSRLASELRKTPLAKRGKKAKEKRERDFGAKARAVAKMGCVVCGRRPSDPHHEPPRSRGGNKDGLVPLCPDHHTLAPDSRHRLGSVARFDEVHGIDLVLEAQRIDTWWRSIQ